MCSTTLYEPTLSNRFYVFKSKEIHIRTFIPVFDPIEFIMNIS